MTFPHRIWRDSSGIITSILMRSRVCGVKKIRGNGSYCREELTLSIYAHASVPGYTSTWSITRDETYKILYVSLSVIFLGYYYLITWSTGRDSTLHPENYYMYDMQIKYTYRSCSWLTACRTRTSLHCRDSSIRFAGGRRDTTIGICSLVYGCGCKLGGSLLGQIWSWTRM